MQPILHNYFRSSTSHRVPIALALKGVSYDHAAFHLRKGEHRGERFASLNPQRLFRRTWTDGKVYTQSLAIIEFLDDVVPSAPLLPSDPAGKARVRILAHMIALDVHPINNLRVLDYLRREFGADDGAIARWFAHWVHEPLHRSSAVWRASPRPGHTRMAIRSACLISALRRRSPATSGSMWICPPILPSAGSVWR